MAKLSWGNPADRSYQAGLDRGVLYPRGRNGVAWDGLVSFNETPVGGEAVPYYQDGIKYRNDSSAEELTATLEAYMYPDEFDECDGSAFYAGLGFEQQARKPFNLSYRTQVGNAVDGFGKYYKIHLIYNAQVAPAARARVSKNETPDPLNFSWLVTTMPEHFRGMRPTAHLIIDSRKTNNRLLAVLEDILYGTEATSPRFPTPEEIVNLYAGSLEIKSNRITGLGKLVDFENHFDLMGNREVGIYSRPANSRLKPSAVPGIYRLET